MAAQGSREARGYGAAHQKLRAQWAPKVQAGDVSCWRCGLPIPPDAPWHLGHDDDDRTKYRGPEHAGCNIRGPRRRDKKKAKPEGHPGLR